MKRLLASLAFAAALALPVQAQTSPAYRKDALELANLQQRVLNAADGKDSTKFKALVRVESGRLLKFSKKYQSYVVQGAVPNSNLMLGSNDEILAMLAGTKDATKRKELMGQAVKTLENARRLIGQGK